MQTNQILVLIDEEIAHLQKVRSLLLGAADEEETKKQRGRPKGSLNKAAKSTKVTSSTSAKRIMSEDGRARIAAAQKLRWAAAKKAVKAAKKAVRKESPLGAKKTNQPAKKLAQLSVKKAKPSPAKKGKLKSVPTKTAPTHTSAADSMKPEAQGVGEAS